MPIKIKSTSGSVTLTAQDTNGDQTLTVPSQSGATLQTTADTITSSRLSGALPAISGASLTNLPAGGVDGITSASSSGTAISIASNNNVGVGIGTPTLIAGTGMHLHSSGSDCRFHISNNTVGGTSGDGAYLFMGSDGTFGIQQKESADMKFYNSGGVVLEIKNDGRGLSQFTAKAWITFNGITPAILDSHNVSSLTDNATGDYYVNFSNSPANANYSVVGSVGPTGLASGGDTHLNLHRNNWSGAPDMPTTSRFRVCTDYANPDGTNWDLQRVHLVVFGD